MFCVIKIIIKITNLLGTQTRIFIEDYSKYAYIYACVKSRGLFLTYFIINPQEVTESQV